jgi:hypothetical protein
MIRFNSISLHLIFWKNTRVRHRSTNLLLRICANWPGTQYCKVDGRCRSRNIGWVIVGTYPVRLGMISTRPMFLLLGLRIDMLPCLRNCKLSFSLFVIERELTCSSLIQHGTKPVSSTRPQTHMKTPIPGPSRSPSAPARPLAQGANHPSRPGMPTHSSDVAAAAMAMGNVTSGMGGMNINTGADAVNRVGAGMQAEFLVGGLGEMDERQRKRSGSQGTGGGKLEMSHDIRR